ncbi:hypothetical protein BpHYR1_051680 [Brachionus plicatilis]|uniref:Uncharacterized protein n=1 Tax=Brachionus plicatilis TaxID=10195 RepID=A0A3M7SQT2_BRAPC|nr:hypothetical protein BpHYR1_051680 [Brachionus plicatilis]
MPSSPGEESTFNLSIMFTSSKNDTFENRSSLKSLLNPKCIERDLGVLSSQLFSVGIDGSFKTHRTRPLASKDLHPTTGVLALRSPKMIRSSPISQFFLTLERPGKSFVKIFFSLIKNGFFRPLPGVNGTSVICFLFLIKLILLIFQFH